MAHPPGSSSPSSRDAERDFGSQIVGHYLDTATYGIPASGVVETVFKEMTRWREGSADWREDWEPEAEAARSLFAGMLRVPAHSIALVPAVSVATGIVATAVPSGAEVLVAEEDFVSLLYPFVEAERSGRLRVRAVPLVQLAEAVDSATAMVAVSHVQSADGTVADVSSLREATRRVGASLYLDATHSVGVLPVDSPAWQADYLSCAAYKWLCCPRGVGFLFVEPSRWSHPFSLAASWRGEAQPHAPHYGPVSKLTEDARRFDVSVGWHAWVGARQALEAVASVGDERRYAIALALGRRLADQFDLPAPEAGIVSVPIRSAEEAQGALERHGVRATVRRDTVRFSPHFYNSEADVDAAVAALRPCRT